MSPMQAVPWDADLQFALPELLPGEVSEDVMEEATLQLYAGVQDNRLYLNVESDSKRMPITEISITQVNGEALPAWLQVDTNKRQFTGTPPADLDNMPLRIEVGLSDGLKIIRYVDVDITNGKLSELTYQPELQLAGTTPFTQQISDVAGQFQDGADDLLAAFAV